jgi:ABC-type cobalamin transport system ATPase subunit
VAHLANTKGMGLNIMKFHGILHLMEDIQVNGVPLEFDTAANESHHKASKYAAQLTQKKESVFQMQVAKRLWEFKVLNHALEEIQSGVQITDYFDVDSDELSESSSEPPSSSAGCANQNDDGGSDTNKNPIDNMTYDARIIVFLD